MDVRYDKYVKRDLRKRSMSKDTYARDPLDILLIVLRNVSTPWISGTTNLSKETYARDLLNIETN